MNEDHGQLSNAPEKLFGRLFPGNEVFFQPQVMRLLGETMVDGTGQFTSSTIGVPAPYTYFGQFVDHDITRDAAGGEPPPDSQASSLPVQLATPQVDLDCLYGKGNVCLDNYGRFQLGKHDNWYDELFDLDPAQPGYWARRARLQADLPRDYSGHALIADSRNEDNLAVAAIHLLFMQFHNRLMDELGGAVTRQKVEGIKTLVIRHYQAIILFDFLARITPPGTVDKVNHPNYQYRAMPASPAARRFMPLEFSQAAFRFGHSMVRNHYNWNARRPNERSTNLLKNTSLTSLPEFDMRLTLHWKVDWDRFFANEAHAIDTRLAEVLGSLPHSGGGNLASRNLVRGATQGLPTGQTVAVLLGATPIGPTDFSTAYGRDALFKDYGLNRHTPLWFYILQEAELNGGRLGEVGACLVVETLHWLIRGTDTSIITQPWSPTEAVAGDGTQFTLKDLVDYVHG